MERFLLNDGKALAIIEASSLAEAQRFVRERGHTGELGDAAAVQRAVEAARQEQTKAWARLGVTEAVALRDRWGAPIAPIPVVRVYDQLGASSSGSNVQVSEQARRIREAVNREVQPILASIRALRTPITEQQRPGSAAGSVELRETDAQPMSESEKAEAVRAWMVLGLSEAAARAAVKGE